MKKLFETLLFLAFIFALPNSLFSSTFTENLEKDIDFNSKTTFVFNDFGATINYQDPTSFSVEEKTKAIIKVFPNPASEKLFIQFKSWKGVKDIKLHNITGKCVYMHKTVDNNYEIDISTFPKGIYLITLKNGYNQIVKKLKFQ